MIPSVMHAATFSIAPGSGSSQDSTADSDNMQAADDEHASVGWSRPPLNDYTRPKASAPRNRWMWDFERLRDSRNGQA
jgi:hypothetical protein